MIRIKVSQEIIEGVNALHEYILNECAAALARAWDAEWKKIDYEIINGEESYDELMYGGAPGL